MSGDIDVSSEVTQIHICVNSGARGPISAFVERVVSKKYPDGTIMVCAPCRTIETLDLRTGLLSVTLVGC